MNQIIGGMKLLFAIVAIATVSEQAVYANDPPEITSFSVQHLVGDSWWLHGTVDDDFPEGVLVQFSGVAQTAISIDADGSFSFVATVTSSGIVDVTAYDELTQESATESDYISLQ